MKKITQIILLFLLLPCLSHAEWTSLHQAAYYGNLEQAQNFIDGGADVNAADENGWTPLYLAARKGHEAMIRLFIEKGADVNAPARIYFFNRFFGEAGTPLDYAKNPNVITLLRCWQKLTQERKEQMYTFLLATHSPDSPAVSLPKELSRHIWQFVKQPTIAELDQEILQQEIAQQKLAEQSNRSWISNAWIQGGAAASAIAGLGILGYQLFKKR